MKCDELKPLVFSIRDFGYVDEPTPQPNFQNPHDHAVYKATEVDAAIAELKAALNESEEARYEAGADAADYYQENRRLKRALWIARAYRAEARKNYWYARSCHEGDKYLWSIDGSAVKYIGCIKRTNFDWLKVWSEVERKCRAKAEEYK